MSAPSSGLGGGQGGEARRQLAGPLGGRDQPPRRAAGRVGQRRQHRDASPTASPATAAAAADVCGPAGRCDGRAAPAFGGHALPSLRREGPGHYKTPSDFGAARRPPFRGGS